MLADLVGAGMRVRRRPRRPRRPRQRGARQHPPQGARLRAARRAGRGARRRPRAEDRRRRRARRLPERRQVRADRRDVRGPAEDRRLPVHHAGAQPRRGRRPATTLFTVADVPGLIPGASEGKGLGLEFLRHVERCPCWCTCSTAPRSSPDRDPITDLDVIEAELAAVRRSPRATSPTVLGSSRSTRSTCPRRASSPSSCGPTSRRAAYRCSRSRAVAHDGLRELVFAMAELVAQRRAQRDRRGGRRASCSRPRAVDDTGLHRHARGGRRGRPLPRARRAARSAGCARPTSPTTRPSATSRTGSRGSASRTSCSSSARCPVPTVVIGAEDDAVVFDFEPTIAAGTPLGGPRGSDDRLLGH